MEGYKHIHFHIIPKTNEFDPELKGSKAFQYLKIKEVDNEKQKRIIELCKEINEYMQQIN
jgi:diadenosine tetraphosphate (Ap4A) HIT family hydrolase